MKKSYLIPILLMAALFALVTGCERKVTVQDDGTGTQLAACFTCHNDDGRINQAQGEWANSIHASGTSIDYTNRGDGNDCTRCHDQEGFIDFLNTGSVNAPYDVVSAIGCFTCHDPHNRGDMSLRTEDPVTLANGTVFNHGKGNLCVHCHEARSSVSVITLTNYTVTSSRFGPHHGPQGDMIEGTNLFTDFPSFTAGQSTHKNAVRDACAGCHMGNVQSHGGYTVGGHSFNMEDEEGNSQVAFCTPCHATATSKLDFTADQDYDGDGLIEGYQTEVEGLLDTLRVLLIDQGILNGSTGLAKTGTYADGRIVGCYWNYNAVEEDRSLGVHNYKYIVSVLQASIEYLESHPPASTQAVVLPETDVYKN